VAQVSSNTRATADIIESKFRNTRVELEQERERLANATSGTEDSDLGGLAGRGREGPLLEEVEGLTSGEHFVYGPKTKN
jgi:hypothetical protein